MAIQVGGTTVIDNSRALVNLGAAITAAQGGTGLTSPGASGNVLTSNGTGWTSAPMAASGGSITATASGSITAGKAVIVNSDGTVSQVGGTLINPFTTGSPATVYSGVQLVGNPTMCAYDPISNTYVYCFQDSSSFWGRVVAVSVSGTTSTAGSMNVFNYNTTNIMCIGRSSTGIIVAYQNGAASNFMVACGTISGTTITLGTSVNTGVLGTAASLAYDPSTGVTMLVTGSGSSGTAVAITVSGTTPTIGSSVSISGTAWNNPSVGFNPVLNKFLTCADDTGLYAIQLTADASRVVTMVGSRTFVGISGQGSGISNTVYDPNTQQFVVVDRSSSNNINARTVQISGTSITKGTATFVASGDNPFSATYDSSSNRVLVVYRDNFSLYAAAIPLAVSGTSITAGSVTTVNASSTSGLSIVSNGSTAPLMGTVVSSNLSAFVLTTSAPNLTSENYVGFASANYSSGQTATIKIAGSTDTNQSGLTPGQSYYVQTSGGIGLAPDSPSVFAGVALTSTSFAINNPAPPDASTIALTAGTGISAGSPVYISTDGKAYPYAYGTAAGNYTSVTSQSGTLANNTSTTSQCFAMSDDQSTLFISYTTSGNAQVMQSIRLMSDGIPATYNASATSLSSNPSGVYAKSIFIKSSKMFALAYAEQPVSSVNAYLRFYTTGSQTSALTQIGAAYGFGNALALDMAEALDGTVYIAALFSSGTLFVYRLVEATPTSIESISVGTGTPRVALAADDKNGVMLTYSVNSSIFSKYYTIAPGSSSVTIGAAYNRSNVNGYTPTTSHQVYVPTMGAFLYFYSSTSWTSRMYWEILTVDASNATSRFSNGDFGGLSAFFINSSNYTVLNTAVYAPKEDVVAAVSAGYTVKLSVSRSSGAALLGIGGTNSYFNSGMPIVYNGFVYYYLVTSSVSQITRGILNVRGLSTETPSPYSPAQPVGIAAGAAGGNGTVYVYPAGKVATVPAIGGAFVGAPYYVTRAGQFSTRADYGYYIGTCLSSTTILVKA